jgi:CLIP-associating protein 1/2
MAKRQVRKGIATYVLQQLGLTSSSAPELVTSSVRSQDGHDDDTASSRQGGKSIAGSMASSTYVGSMPGSDMEELEPLFVNTNRELEDMMDAMLPSFEGRESEHNWMARDTSIAKIRQLLRGNAYRDYQATFLTKIKALLDGILKALNSLRTQLSTSGGQCIKDLAIVAGPGIDPFVEILLVSLIKKCAATKKLASQLAQVVVAVIFANVSYHPKVLQHVWYACQDKNVQPRLYAAGWITIFLEAHADYKAHIEHTGGVDTFSKCIKKGLADANPGVRENMRNTYWKFGSIWPESAQA